MGDTKQQTATGNGRVWYFNALEALEKYAAHLVSREAAQPGSTLGQLRPEAVREARDWLRIHFDPEAHSSSATMRAALVDLRAILHAYGTGEATMGPVTAGRLVTRIDAALNAGGEVDGKGEGVHLGLLDDMEHEAKYSDNVFRREAELRIHALGAAISRRDWHAVEQAHAAIRDKFYSPAPPTPAKGD